MHQESIRQLTPNQWELFAQDVLFQMGFKILTGPSEGVDGGLDLKVRKNDKNYLVSCKHKKTSKNIGIRDETNIRDRVEQHSCQGFIPFYASGISSGLQSQIQSLQKSNIDVIEIYLDNILEIIPLMPGFILQKYFPRPQEMHHHLAVTTSYKPLKCMNEECAHDIISKERIHLSLSGFCLDENNVLHLIYGCKKCVGDICTDLFWTEIDQIRYIEQMFIWRSIIDKKINENDVSIDFYKHWALLQEAVLQVQIPQGWGQWI